ncbi:hypothetical protein B0H14DRAFT_2580721 [Mycena olivaceomarginata]|nr:hypothetical protein B0H14DRAFT_2580721 [Mycena olivaceomarginata]
MLRPDFEHPKKVSDDLAINPELEKTLRALLRDPMPTSKLPNTQIAVWFQAQVIPDALRSSRSVDQAIHTIQPNRNRYVPVPLAMSLAAIHVGKSFDNGDLGINELTPLPLWSHCSLDNNVTEPRHHNTLPYSSQPLPDTISHNLILPTHHPSSPSPPTPAVQTEGPVSHPVWFEKLFEKRAGREEPLEDDEENINDVAVETLDGLDLYLLDPLATMEDFEALLSAMEDAIVLPQPAAAVLLGRTWNLPGILKRAFYELLRTKPDEPPTRDDETVNMSNRLEGWEMADITRLGEAQKHLTAAWLSVLTIATSDTCKMPCPASRRTASSTAAIAEVVLKHQLDPICSLDALMAGNWASIHGCKVCGMKQKSSFAKNKVQIWEDMDVWLAIPVEDEEEEEDGDD